MNCMTGPHGDIPSFLGSMKNLRYLNLSGVQFTGRLPPEFGNLTKLQYLDLGAQFSDPEISVTDMIWLANLPFLQYLSLRRVNLSGIAEWPDKLSMLPSLRVLRLSSCSLDSSNQLLQHLSLTKLEMLDLSSNNFDYSVASDWSWKVTNLKYLTIQGGLYGEFPEAIANMTSLQVLDLSHNSNGFLMIPESLKNLCSLKIVDLSYNDIEGDITVFMEKLPRCAWNKLQELRLTGNNFAGTLPNMIGQFTSLTVLDLKSNNLTGGIPPELGNCKGLNTLDLSFNNIVGPLTTEVRYLLGLNILQLSNNHLNGSVPSQIGTFKNLTCFDLSNNNFSGVITEEHFAGLVSLKKLDLSSNDLKVVVGAHWVPPFRLEYARFASCQMGPRFPAWLQWQKDITKLDISSTSIEDNLPDWFWSTFSQAEHIDISHNKISGRLPVHLKNMPFVQLNLSSNQFTGSIPGLPINISMLDLSNNSFSGTLPSDLEGPQLQRLLLYSNRIGGRIPESLCKLQLDFLDLSFNILEGGIPQCFDTELLRFLLLSNNRLSGMFPAIFQHCTSLEFLDLSSNKFSGTLPSWIGEMNSLQFLQLRNNAFSGNIPVEITHLRSLQYLDISGNKLSGVIPRHLSNMTGMTMKGHIPLFFIYFTHYTVPNDAVLNTISYIEERLSITTKGQQLIYGNGLAYFVGIDLSGNSLTGEIPWDITLLDAIINLNLSSNCLSGKIPDNIGGLLSLESLDLSKNKLLGEIPSSLSNLTSLSYLNLSYNSLSGRIPSGRQLDTLNADNPSSMYVGNSGLCGPPLHTDCSGNVFIHGYSSNNSRELEQMPFHVGLLIGVVVGLWMVFCILLFMRTWRNAYFLFFDKLCDRIYVLAVLKWACLTRKESTE
jgi:Leucine-rich repeat (LRR) protein